MISTERPRSTRREGISDLYRDSTSTEGTSMTFFGSVLPERKVSTLKSFRSVRIYKTKKEFRRVLFQQPSIVQTIGPPGQPLMWPAGGDSYTLSLETRLVHRPGGLARDLSRRTAYGIYPVSKGGVTICAMLGRKTEEGRTYLSGMSRGPGKITTAQIAPTKRRNTRP